MITIGFWTFRANEMVGFGKHMIPITMVLGFILQLTVGKCLQFSSYFVETVSRQLKMRKTVMLIMNLHLWKETGMALKLM